MNATEVFEKEWAMYGEWGTGNGERGTGRSNDGTDSFDGGVKPGEIRIFADMERPFVALVVESKGLAGWTIVPLSPFTVRSTAYSAVPSWQVKDSTGISPGPVSRRKSGTAFGAVQFSEKAVGRLPA